MAKGIETVSTINSAVRTVLALIVFTVLGYAGFKGYETYNAKDIATAEANRKLGEVSEKLEVAHKTLQIKDKEIERQTQKINEQEKEIAQLASRLKLLKVDHRLARLDIVKQTTSEDGKIESTVHFVELNDEGEPIGKPLTFILAGEMIYIDGLVVKFNDNYVEQADLNRGSSLFAFKRIFTDRQNPKDGYPLDIDGLQPQAYARGGQPSDFEKKIWGDFWTIANDEARSKELGIRSNHGQAVSIKPVERARYKLELRASDGLSVTRDGDVPEKDRPAA